MAFIVCRPIGAQGEICETGEDLVFGSVGLLVELLAQVEKNSQSAALGLGETGFAAQERHFSVGFPSFDVSGIETIIRTGAGQCA